VALALVFITIGSAQSEAALIYDVRACTAVHPCDVQPVPHGTGTAPGPTNEDFIEYFDMFAGVDESSRFDWNVISTNANGYSIGSVIGPNGIHASFSFHDGEVLCCTTDNWGFSDINDNDLIVGWGDREGRFSGGFLADVRGEVVPFFLSASANAFFAGLGFHDQLPIGFSAIDNSNRMLGYCAVRWCGSLQFDVSTPQAVPAPDMLWLFALGLLVMLAMRKRFFA
jgi:hypothetical protein